jgi:hypothetical protein
MALLIPAIHAQQIEIKGIVKDSRQNGGIGFINVALWTADSTLVGGTATDDGGRFAIAQIAPGDYRLAVSGVGYRRQVITLDGLKSSIDIPDILLEEESFELSGVTVTASNTRVDRKVVFPTEQQLKSSTNGIDLLNQLSLPKVSVNMMNMSATLIGSGELQYRINGAKVEVQDVLALQPADVIRVEYHDNPGLRYGNAEVVLDYIVRRPETGGNGGLRSDSDFEQKFMNTNIYGRINHKKSEFSVNYFVNFRDFNSMWRDNEEKFSLGDGTVLNRKEEGIPGRLKRWQHNINTAYSYQNERRMLNATFRYFRFDQPNFDYRGTLYNMANPTDRVKMIDNTALNEHRPALDLYYQENLKNDQTIVLNVVGTYNYSDNHRFYDESRDGESLTHVDNRVVGKKYSWIGEGIYEKALGANRLSAGIRHIQSYSNNEYRNGNEYKTDMTQGETFLYAELKGKVKKLDYMVGVGVTRSSFSQSDGEGNQGDGQGSNRIDSQGDSRADGYSNYAFNPRLTLQYSLPGQSNIRLRAEVTNMSPSLSELSAVDQTVDSLQIQRGNPSLKPYLNYSAQLTYNYSKSLFNLNVESFFGYRPNPVMDEKFPEGGKIIQTWNNQQSMIGWNNFIGLRIGPIKDILQLSLRGGMRYFVSNGNTYRHTFTSWYTNSEITGMYKNATLGIGIDSNQDFFIGETMQGGENLHYIVAGYKYRNANLQFIMFNPFVDNYREVTENRSQYASYRRSMYINDTSHFMILRFSWNFSFGRTFKSAEKRISNTDDDSGVKGTGK